MKNEGRGRAAARRAFYLLTGVVVVYFAAVIDPSSFLRSIPKDTRPAPVVTWPRSEADPYISAVTGAGYAGPAGPAGRAGRADRPQRQEDLQPSIIIEDFSRSDAGGFPPNWKAWRGDDRLAHGMYTVREENGNQYLHAADDGSSIIIRKQMSEWDANEYPVLSWRWRAQVLPEGGDERIVSRNDSAVAVYVVLDQNFVGVPKTLKYVWSSTLPVGTYHRRDGIGRPHVIVLESGEEKLGRWVAESVDVCADYVRIFGKEPPRKAVGIGILTDGNATGTESKGDYDDFVVHRRGIYR